jgi:uncharacterized membrane-anchored protein YhcB (DUF1043 family)
MEKALVALAETVNRTAKIQQRHAKVLMKLRQEVAEARAEANRRFAELAEAQRRTEESLGALRREFLEHRAETDRRFAELAEALRRLVERVDRIEQDVGMLKDHDLRRRYVELAPSYFGRPNFRKVRALTPSELLDRLLAALDEGKIRHEDFEEARRIDVVIRGEWEGRTLHFAMETSWTIDRWDVERAVRRAQLLLAVLGETWPAVAGSRLTEGACELLQRMRAEGQTIVVAQDGEIEWPS